MFNIVKNFYNAGIYSNTDVRVFVKANKITAQEYELITNEAYSVA